MTSFEQKLIDKGYKKYIYNCKTSKYHEQSSQHIISTMVNLDHRYFPPDVDPDKCKDGEICFGLCEYGKPPTLVYPRPRIFVKRMVNGKTEWSVEDQDDNMNVVLAKYSFDEIFEAMYDRNIYFDIDLTK